MIPSRTLAAPGLRTSARPSWRFEVGTALTVVAGQPMLWLLGTIGFALRGGILLFILPIVVLPTQVEVRLALGGYLGSTGLTPDFWVAVAIGSALAAMLGIAVLLLLARIDVASFMHLVRDPESADVRGWRSARRLHKAEHRALLGRVFAVKVLALLGLVLFTLPLASAVGQATLDELLRPSSSDSIYARVLSHVTLPLFLLVIGVVVVEALSALATRRLALRATGFSPARPSPLRTLRTATLGWLLMIAALIPSLWAISVAWQATRASFLATTSLAEVGRDAGLIVIACLLAAVVFGGLLLAGFASAVRAALWSVDSLAAAAVDDRRTL